MSACLVANATEVTCKLGARRLAGCDVLRTGGRGVLYRGNVRSACERAESKRRMRRGPSRARSLLAASAFVPASVLAFVPAFVLAFVPAPAAVFIHHELLRVAPSCCEHHHQNAFHHMFTVLHTHYTPVMHLLCVCLALVCVNVSKEKEHLLSNTLHSYVCIAVGEMHKNYFIGDVFICSVSQQMFRCFKCSVKFGNGRVNKLTAVHLNCSHAPTRQFLATLLD